jgi:hypothetical protein
MRLLTFSADPTYDNTRKKGLLKISEGLFNFILSDYLLRCNILDVF